MTKIKKWFSFSLYKEGLRQLKVITFLFSLLAAVYGILSNVGIWVNASQYEDPANFTPILRTMPWAQPFLMISFCVVTPILTLCLFRFMNSRKDSDFYHALPETRLCLFISFFAAILTCTVIYIAACVLSVGISCLALSSWVRLDWGEMLQYAAHMFAASVYVAAFVSIAMAVTGTFLSNVIVSGLLIFGPRIILTAVSHMVSSNLPFVLTEYRSPLLNNNYNIVNGLIFGFLGLGNNYSYSTVLTSPAAFWSTLAMAFVLTGIAAFLFCLRKSEAAGQSAPNRILGAVYRLFLTYVVSLIPVGIIFDFQINHYSVNRSDIFNLFIIYLIVAGVFYLYELLMTKKLKRLWEITPSFLLIPLLNVLTLVFMITCYSNALSFTPGASEISGIQIVASRNYNWDYDAYCYDYYEKKSESISLDDDVIREIIARNLSAETAALQDGTYWEYENTHYNYVNVAIVTDRKTAYRSIYMDSMDMLALTNQLSSHPQLEAVYATLPDRNAASFQMLSNDIVIGRNSALENEIYEALQQDMAEMGFVKWYSYIHQYNGYPYSLDYLQLSVNQNGSPLILGIPITSELPHTAAAYINSLPDPQEVLQQLSHVLEQYEDGTLRYMDLYLGVGMPDGHAYGLNASIWNYEGEGAAGVSGLKSFESLQNVVRDLISESANPIHSQIMINLSCNWYVDDGKYSGDYSFDSAWIGLDELPESIREWMAYQYDEEIFY